MAVTTNLSRLTEGALHWSERLRNLSRVTELWWGFDSRQPSPRAVGVYTMTPGMNRGTRRSSASQRPCQLWTNAHYVWLCKDIHHSFALLHQLALLLLHPALLLLLHLVLLLLQL